VQYLNDDGEWVTIASFRQPLDADYFYRMMRDIAVRRIRQVRIFVLADSEES
jgi:hypothetical protein